MHTSEIAGRGHRVAMMDRVFPGACAAAFVILLAIAVEAALLYWR